MLVTLLLVLLSVFLASLPMIVLLAVVWWMDRYEREPIWLVSLVFLWGAIGGVFLGGTSGFILTVPVQLVFGSQAGDIAGAVMIAPFVEEISKGLIILVIVWNRNFDNATDGFVYGAATGLGFGMVENLMYFALVSGDPAMWFGTVFMRTLFSAPMHMLASSCFGATVGYAKWIRRAWAYVLLPPLGLVTGMTIHFLWNLFAVAAEQFQSGIPFLLSILIFCTELLLIFIVFQASLWGESRMIRRELDREVHTGLIPQGHVDHIASYLGRFGSSWLAPGVHKGRYIRKATELAFRMAERDRCDPGSNQHGFYESEVQRLRNEIWQMLSQGRR
jgi:RsiW-degrading membrane proteinase PrsW (M82 family)